MKRRWLELSAGSRALPIALLLLALGARTGGAAELSPAKAHDLIADLMSEVRETRQRAAKKLIEASDLSLVPALVDGLFFTPKLRRDQLLQVLTELTGESLGSYHEWVDYVGRQPGPAPKAGYLDWKRSLFQRIDEDYAKILYPNAPARIRLEEIVWGGVPVDGIPSLDEPPTVPAATAGYLLPGERVFGVVVGGEARAYPLRFLDWHEMLNDRVGGRHVTLSYCTLCGSGILYATDAEGGDHYVFGTSGLLYRSNKLMYDRQTLTLWSNLTGEPVVGRLVTSGARLEVLPMTLTTWAEWRTWHPDTRVLDLDRITARAVGGVRFDYRPGAADEARRGVSFPLWQKSSALDRDTEIFALRIGDAAKAWPIERVLEEQVVNDELGGEPLVLVASSSSGAVRAYRRGQNIFSAAGEENLLVDGLGRAWRVEEGALVPQAEGSDAQPQSRLAGHVAYWFGWYGFYPNTEIYGGADDAS